MSIILHITYPYRYELPNAVVVTPPVPVEGLMAGSMADMVIPGTAQNGRMAYCVTTYLGGYQNFSTAVPKADMPGTYYVYYFAFAKASDGYFSSPFDYVMVTVSKIDPVLMLEIDDWNEGETPCTPQVSDPPTGASMIYEYKERGADDSTYSTIVPIVAGEYTVRATYPGDDIYNSASATADFSIIRTAS
ncbi:MAG: hypothetical protein J6Y89_01760, partial [Lachnospiraceae bacterium]|nr:hypothetical protein [Lachnospiraceae bacterium]